MHLSHRDALKFRGPETHSTPSALFSSTSTLEALAGSFLLPGLPKHYHHTITQLFQKFTHQKPQIAPKILKNKKTKIRCHRGYTKHQWIPQYFPIFISVILNTIRPRETLACLHPMTLQNRRDCELSDLKIYANYRPEAALLSSTTGPSGYTACIRLQFAAPRRG